MTIPASQALAYTNNAIQLTSSAEVAREIQLTESFIRTATSQERFRIIYNARIVGNPLGDPFDDDLLTPVQIEYRDAWVLAGYQVSRNEDTGYWVISWEPMGPESLVTQYSVRTVIDPLTASLIAGSPTSSSAKENTIKQIELFFSGLIPAATVNVFLIPIVGIGGPGDINEGDFGAPASQFYEYIILATQPTPIDYGAAIVQTLEINVRDSLGEALYNPPAVPPNPLVINLAVYKFN